MPETNVTPKSVYHCVCGSRSTEGAPLRNGYPARRCKDCEAEWSYTTCFKCGGGHRTDIDERVAVRCGECGWWHCPECNACQPRDLCQCPGTCQPRPIAQP